MPEGYAYFLEYYFTLATNFLAEHTFGNTTFGNTTFVFLLSRFWGMLTTSYSKNNAQ